MNTSAIARSAYLAAVTVFACVVALLTFAFVVTLPKNAGAQEFIDKMLSEKPLLAFVALPLSILFLVAPFYAAKWTYRGIMNACITSKMKHTEEKKEPNQ